MKSRLTAFCVVLPALLAALFFSCDDTDPTVNRATLWLTDTLGHEQTTFRSGEDFVAHALWIHDPWQGNDGFMMPLVDCGIWRGDSLVADATWGCIFLMADAQGLPRDTLQLHWRGPRGQCQDEPVLLPPGAYEARAAFSPLFGSDPPPQAPPVAFIVQP